MGRHNTPLRCAMVSNALCSWGSDMRIGFEGVYGWLLLLLLTELEDLPSQFMGLVSDGR